MKILIVDDESLIRAGMRAMVPWEKHGYTLVGEAVNGLHALELARKYLPDIILVDILMPGMDGLDFIRIIQEEQPLCKFIILSCMNEIDYYKKALCLGVREYILKSSIDADSVLGAIGRVAEEIRKERVYDSQEDTGKAHANKYLVLTEFANLILKNKIKDPETIARKFHSYDIPLLSSGLFVLAFSSDYSGQKEIKYDGSLDYSIVNICQQLVSTVCSGYVFINYEDTVTAILSYSGTRAPEEFVRFLSGRIREMLMQCLDITVTIGISRELGAYTEIARGYSDAVTALENSFYAGRGREYLFCDHAVHRDTALALQEERLKILKINSMDSIDGVLHRLESIRQLLTDRGGFPVTYAMNLYLDILYHIEGICSREGINLQEFTGESVSLDRFIGTPGTLAELHKLTGQLLFSLKTHYERISKTSHMDIVGLIKKHVRNNIDKKITLKSISDEIHLCPNYICRYFKKETGINLFDFILTCKIEKSKELLELQHNLAEVASILGFSSASHYIKSFKKYTGVTPGQFARQHALSAEQ